MFKKDPEGYRKLLVYQKAQNLHNEILEFVALFPRTKTFIDLADQISRSMRSTVKNLVEGWKRNTTKEYFDFLGFSIGSNSEMMEDLADIATGIYKELTSIMGIMGERGTPSSHLTPSPLSSPYTPFAPLTPLTPLTPLIRAQLDALKFYPLDPTLPPAVKLFLKSKEIGFLFYKLQQSLDIKMDNEHTKPASQRFKNYFDEQKEADRLFAEDMKKLGLKRLENGQYVDINEEKDKGV